MMSSIHQASQGQKRVADTNLQAAAREKVAGKQFSNHVTLDPNEGTLFLKALKDGAVTNEAKLLSVKGSLKTASAVQAEMAKPGAQYIDSGMTANTMVLAQQAGTLELPHHSGAC